MTLELSDSAFQLPDSVLQHIDVATPGKASGVYVVIVSTPEATDEGGTPGGNFNSGIGKNAGDFYFSQ